MVTTNLDGFSLANHRRFTKFANFSTRQIFLLYGMKSQMFTGLLFWRSPKSQLEQCHQWRMLIGWWGPNITPTAECHCVGTYWYHGYSKDVLTGFLPLPIPSHHVPSCSTAHLLAIPPTPTLSCSEIRQEWQITTKLTISDFKSQLRIWNQKITKCFAA